MITALEVLAYKEASLKEALSTMVRPVGNSVAFDKKIEPKDKAVSAPMAVGIKPGKALGAPTAPMAMMAAR